MHFRKQPKRRCLGPRGKRKAPFSVKAFFERIVTNLSLSLNSDSAQSVSHASGTGASPRINLARRANQNAPVPQPMHSSKCARTRRYNVRHRTAWEVRGHGAAAARRIIAEGMSRERLKQSELAALSKGDPRKARIAAAGPLSHNGAPDGSPIASTRAPQADSSTPDRLVH
jgi:hypothetical protein